VVVVGGTAEAQAPTKPTNTATAAARATFFRSFILGLPQLGTLFGNREPLIRDFNFNSDSESHRRPVGVQTRSSNKRTGPGERLQFADSMAVGRVLRKLVSLK